MFEEAVSLYKNNRNRYQEILITEKSAVSKNSEKKATEKRRKKAMAEKSNTAEQDFFQWLPNAVTPSVLRDIQKSYAQINVLLIKLKALPQTLTSITSTDDVELLCVARRRHLQTSAFVIQLYSFLLLISFTFVRRQRIKRSQRMCLQQMTFNPVG